MTGRREREVRERGDQSMVTLTSVCSRAESSTATVNLWRTSSFFLLLVRGISFTRSVSSGAGFSWGRIQGKYLVGHKGRTLYRPVHPL